MLLSATLGFGQSYPHYTMFMFNKLLYNPAYAGNKNLTTVNANYRNQWTGIDGAPKTLLISADGPVGNYVKPFRRVAVGVLMSNEQLGVTNNTNLMAYYAYRIPFEKSVLSFGLQAGGSFYTANYSKLDPSQSTDQLLTNDIKSAVLPNFGAGVYYSGSNYYISGSTPNLLENYYDKNNKINNEAGRQLRSYYLGGGYVFTLNDELKLEPQALARYAAGGGHDLPMNADINLSLIIADRLLVGATYRTDKSVEGIVHMQVTNNITLGYAYDHTMSALRHYNNGSHELTLGYDFVKDRNKYMSPRFVKLF